MTTTPPRPGFAPIRLLDRREIVLRPNKADCNQDEGVLNPGAVADFEGNIHLFARVVARGNKSRVMHFSLHNWRNLWRATPHGVVMDINRVQGFLSPTMDGGVEDPRVTWVSALALYVMTYTVFDGRCTRIGIATSSNLFEWQPLGLVSFAAENGKPELGPINNKDGILCSKVYWRAGKAYLALMHRPMFGFGPGQNLPHGVSDHRHSIWISFCPIDSLSSDLSGLLHWRQHSQMMVPEAAYEDAHIGGGTPPIDFHEGSLTFTHGVSYIHDEQGNLLSDGRGGFKRTYSPGVAWLHPDDPTIVLDRSTSPLFLPELPEECDGIVNNVIFPSGAVHLKAGETLLVYGAADYCVGIARLGVDLQSLQPLAAA